MRNRIMMLLAAALLLTLALCGAASAEVVGRTGEGYIHRYTADNGQDIYFVSTSEEPLVETGVDVNFDGHADLAVVTALGASNAFYEFYLWNNGTYEYAVRETDEIVNYTLMDGKYLVSRSNDGQAGMLFHAQVCVWDGNVLKLVRAMTSEEESIIDWEGRVMTQTMNLDRLHVTLWAMEGMVGEAEVLWEKTYEPFPEDASAFDEMNEHLMEGL